MKDKKPNLAQRATLETMTTTQPFELITIDYLYHDQCKEKYEYLLLVVDHFTKFAHTFSTKKQIGMIGTSFNNFLKNFRFPKQNLHDEGKEFDNKLFKRLSEIIGIKPSKTTSYHPVGNRLCKRVNQILLNMLYQKF